MNLFEFQLKQREFVSELINKIPEIAKTMNTLLEIKRKRKIMKATEPIIKGNEGAEDSSELDWDVTANTEQSF